MTKTKTQNRARSIAFAAAALIWCAVIFLLSAQDGTESGATSGMFTELLCRIFMPEFAGFDDSSRAEIISRLSFIVRKGAHFTAYTVLAFLTAQLFFALPLKMKLPARCIAAWGFCVFYAATDELHQYFVPGRAMQLRDVAIDSCGAAAGIAAALIISLLFGKRKSRR